MPRHTQRDGPFPDTGKGDTDPALRRGIAGIGAGITQEVHRREQGAGNRARRGGLEFELHVLGRLETLNQPQLRPAETDVALPPGDAVIDGRRVQGRDHVGRLAGQHTETNAGPLECEVGQAQPRAG